MAKDNLQSTSPSNVPLRVLIIEDTEERQKILTALYRNHAWILVNTTHHAIKLLSAYDFDMISLDYNLRGEMDGAEVARALKSSRNKEAKVVIHSLNPKGVQRILQILPMATPYPVSKMVRSNKVFKRLRANIDQFGVAYDFRA